MTTSGVTTYTRTAQQVVEAAYRKLGIMAKAQTVDSDEVTIGIETLNLAIAELRTKGLNLWKLQSVILPMVAGQTDYVLPQPNKPYKVYQAWLLDNISKTKIPLNPISIFNYNTLPLSTNGTPVQIVYTPGNTDGTIKLWPAPEASVVANKTLYITIEQELQIVVDPTDTIDIPTEWYNALIYYLASLLTNENNIPITDRKDLDERAAEHIQFAMEAGQENASLFFQPMLIR
ncbi:MAG TPA: hypothetical protein VFM18_21420 [Methanosarcina sp.]|nr:hypothetical protein [Methanosarcina sp.]